MDDLNHYTDLVIEFISLNKNILSNPMYEDLLLKRAELSESVDIYGKYIGNLKLNQNDEDNVLELLECLAITNQEVSEFLEKRITLLIIKQLILEERSK